MSYRILFQDKHLVATSKPGGLLVHRSARSSDRVFLLQELRNQIKKRVYPIHRLDRQASGVMVFALSSKDAKALQAAMAAESTKKQYLCFARGHSKDEFTIDRPLTNRSKGKKGEKQEARTDFNTIWRGRIGEGLDCSLLYARLHSGRHHQIRRHLAGEAHFIFGDSNYGKGGINNFLRETYELPRMFLHATRLELDHPVTGERLELFDPLPDDLRAFWERVTELPSALVEKL